MTLDTLRRCRTALRELAAMKEMIRQLEWVGSGLARNGSDGSPRAPGHSDRIAAAVAEIDATELRYAEYAQEYASVLPEVEEWIRTLPPTQSDVMRRRYLLQRSWRTISRETHYSVQSCFRIHALAIKTLDDETH